MRYTVIGAGKSGLAAAGLARSSGAEVFVSEFAGQEQRADAVAALRAMGAEYEFGGHTEKALRDCDTLIVSPGVPPDTPILLRAEELGLPVISELEFAARHLRNPIVAVTGTNGKTTTVSLISYILNQSGRKAVVAGNIGTPLSTVARTVDEDTIVVVEASSYQLDRVTTFRPDVALILNITPDHLSYHKSLANYEEAKYKIFLNQTSENVLILNADDKAVQQCAGRARARVMFFGRKRAGAGAWISGERILLADSIQEEEELMDTLDIRIPGMHNAYNSMAAALAARAFEVRNEDIRDSLASFSGVEHRLERVRERGAVEYVNDSKATNVNATWFALGSYSRPLIWIAGGLGDGNDYAPLDEFARERVRAIISIGAESRNIFNHFCTLTRCLEADSLAAAVTMAAGEAQDGDVVLFSPACKSFDMFTNFEHRGHEFKRLVLEL